MKGLSILLLLCTLLLIPGCQQPEQPEQPPQPVAEKVTKSPPRPPLKKEKASTPAEKKTKKTVPAPPKREFPRTPGNMRTKIDPETGITWYKDKNTPKYNDINSVYLYFGKKNNHPPFLRFRIRYCDTQWLQTMSYIVIADSQRFIQPVTTFKQIRGTTRPQELYDEPVTRELYPMIQKIVSSKKTVIRLHGLNGTGDIMLTDQQKQSMKNVLHAYHQMQ